MRSRELCGLLSSKSSTLKPLGVRLGLRDLLGARTGHELGEIGLGRPHVGLAQGDLLRELIAVQMDKLEEMYSKGEIPHEVYESLLEKYNSALGRLEEH